MENDSILQSPKSHNFVRQRPPLTNPPSCHRLLRPLTSATVALEAYRSIATRGTSVFLPVNQVMLQ